MTDQQWHQATDEEKHAEYLRCQDPVYFYNTYFKTSDGKTPPLMTKERWEEIWKQIEYLRTARFKRLRYEQGNKMATYNPESVRWLYPRPARRRPR